MFLSCRNESAMCTHASLYTRTICSWEVGVVSSPLDCAYSFLVFASAVWMRGGISPTSVLA